MMMSSYLRSYVLEREGVLSQIKRGAVWGVQLLTGFLLSAASLGNVPLPLVMALICTQTGWKAVRMALGGVAGHLVFWGQPGLQGAVWTLLGLGTALTLGHRQLVRETPLLLPAVGSLITALTGLGFQFFFRDTTPLGLFLLRVALAGGAIRIFVLEQREPFARWLSMGFGVLALAQVMPVRYLGLGFLAAGALSSVGAFPAVAVAGLALDLARVTAMPMTAVTCLCFLARLLPVKNKLYPYLLPGVMYALGMGLCGIWDWTPLPGLALGGLLGMVCPQGGVVPRRRGETGVVQVRLELAAGVFAQTQQLLLETPELPVDTQAILQRCVERACGTCPCKKGCREQALAEKLPDKLLTGTYLENIPISCRKTGRLLQELRRGQEQLRTLLADRKRQEEYRSAVLQQFCFAGEFLRGLSDGIADRLPQPRIRFQPQVSVFANRERNENGDRCSSFSGTGGRYYVVLVDGMGRGVGAAEEAGIAAELLQKLLQAGYPSEYALRSLNSLCVLRGRGAAVTVDLAELELSTGKAAVYKWGAAPSLRLTELGAEKVGTATPPPGLSVVQPRETVERLSLRQNEALLLLSDGVPQEGIRYDGKSTSPEALAKSLLRSQTAGDDATVAVIRLLPASQTVQ